MALVVASDLHGSATWTRRLLNACEVEKASQVVLLGDILYHGPRNPLPEGYDPPEVARLLNADAARIVAIRGNCDSEVDSMVLQFPLFDFASVTVDGHRFLCTHGHRFNDQQLPPMVAGDVLLFGHTHIYLAEDRDGLFVLNPGSVSLPKGGRTNTYMVYRNDVCSIKDFSGEVLATLTVV
ncbi:phosphodiesterase [Pleomorphochaeta sp. DL1XJH-081]|jgi:putative phosphoesterase|uniref:phosphodiesterase n=1 Tax=Pleomorphochaeta sp. DL1XJH-081 TaxID=3409690 RepID=UPI003BB5A5AD